MVKFLLRVPVWRGAHIEKALIVFGKVAQKYFITIFTLNDMGLKTNIIVEDNYNIHALK